MKRTRFAAAFCLACLALILSSGCGGGSSSTISIVLATANGLATMDETQPAPAPPSTLNIMASVGDDTSGKGVTWMFETNQSGCGSAGSTQPSCGTLTNNMPFSVTYTAPSITTTLSVIIEAKSNADNTITKTITLSIVLPPVFATTECNPPGVLPCTLTNGNNAVPYTQNFTFTGGVQPYTYTLVGSLPDCLKLNTSSSSTTGTILGTPCGSGPPQQFTIKVTDSGGAAPVSQEFAITIAPAPTLSVTLAPLPVGTLGSIYSGQISTNGGAAPLTWIAVGALPPGLSLNASTGQITGIPINESPGVTYPATYNFTIQVQDSRLPTPQKVPVPAAPFSITIQVPQPLLITTPPGPLASGTTASSSAYSATLNASGGIPPYTWSVIQGQLPAGLALSSHTDGTGSISGTPILATTASFTVQVADSALNPANGNPAPATNSAAFSITITGSVANNTLLSGQYAFLFNGFDQDTKGNIGSVALAGTLTANGDGVITAGTVDSNRTSGVALGGSLTGTYTIGKDGRGTLELTSTFNGNTPIVADYDLVLDSNGNAKFFEDYTTKTSTDSAHTHGEGVLKHVVGPASFGNNNFSGNYAFVLPGYDLTGKPVALAGVFHADGAQTVSPGTSDLNDAGTFSSQSLSGDFTFLSGNRGTTALTFAPGAKPQVTLNFIFYFVTPSDLYFIEADRDNNGAPTLFRLSGEVILQQTSTVFDQTVMQGVSVASGTGVDASGNASVFAGLLTSTLCNQNAAVSLIYDENDGGTINGGAIPPISFAAGTSCAITANGRVSFTGLGTTAAQTRVAVAYLTGPAQGFLLGSDAAVTTGRLEQQTSGPSFALTSFMGGYTISAPFEAEASVKSVVGQLTADGAGNIDGTVDEIDASGAASPNLAQLLGGTYTNPALGTPIGRGMLNTTGTVPSGFPADSIFYVVSPGSVRVISSVPADTHPQLILLDH